MRFLLPVEQKPEFGLRMLRLRQTICRDFLRQRRLSLRCVCVFSPAVSLRVTQTPWAVQRGRANLTFAYPGRLHETVRSLPLADVRACTAFFERNDPL